MLIKMFDPFQSCLIIRPSIGSRFNSPRVGQTALSILIGQVIDALHEQKKGGISNPLPLMQVIAVAHSRLPGWKALPRPRRSEPVTTILGQIWPIIKPVGWHKHALRVGSPSFRIAGRTVETRAEKAATLPTSIIDRYPPEADLQADPMEGHSPEEERHDWDTSVSYKKALEQLFGISSTSPGTDKVTVRLLKACWNLGFGEKLRGLLQRCLEMSHFPAAWKEAEGDLSDPSNWRPIALLSCIGKGL